MTNDQNMRFWRKKRYLVVLLAFFGFFNVYSLRINLSVGIVSMVEEFDWDSKQKGLVLSSFFYGYITTQILGGYLASQFGGNLIFGMGIGVTALFTLITPLAAKISIYALVAVRIIEGIFEGMTYPCCYHIWSRWAPQYEKSRMANFAMAGSYVGAVVALPLCGIFSSKFGWESVFYIFGAIAMVWFFLWMYFVKASPEKDPSISQEEKEYILANRSTVNSEPEKFSDIPWKSILTSMPVWAIIVAHFCESWGFFTMFTELPSFLKDTTNLDIAKSSILSGIPYIALSILLLVSGYLADWFQVKGILTTTQVRRYFNCSSFLAQTIFMLLVAFVLQPVYSVIFLTIGVGLGAFSLSGFAINHLDIAPNYASILMGISNTFGSLPGVISPLLTGVLVQNSTKEEWRVVFYITAALYLVGSIFYYFFCSGKPQLWAQKSVQKTNELKVEEM